MFTTNIVRMDKQGRICISSLFDKVPYAVAILYVIGDTKIQLIDAEYAPIGLPSSCIITLDEKNRIVIPKWLRRQFNTTEWCFGVNEKGDKFLFPKKD